MRPITHIVVHCAATPPSADIGAKEIRQWHLAKKWTDIGYHFVIRRNGTLEAGRPLETPGAHVEGHNANTIGICMVGGVDKGGPEGKPQNNFTDAQWATLKPLVAKLSAQFPAALIWGHRDFPGVTKACPSFDAKKWARENGFKV